MAIFGKRTPKPDFDDLLEMLDELSDEQREKLMSKLSHGEEESAVETAEEEVEETENTAATDEGGDEEAKQDDNGDDEETNAEEESVEGGEVTDAGDAEQETEDAKDEDAMTVIMETLTALEARIAQLEHANEEHDGDEFGVDSDLSDELLPEMPKSYMDAAKKMRY